MKINLLATTAIAALATLVQQVSAAGIDAIGNVDRPTTFISFEGGAVFDASRANTHFDHEDDKLGELNSMDSLDSLQPGDSGGLWRFEFGQELNTNWDYKVGVSAIFLNDDSTEGSKTFTGADVVEDLPDEFGSLFGVDGRMGASQKTSLQLLDVELGYNPQDTGYLQARFFAGVRGLHSKSATEWNYNADVLFLDETLSDVEKLGEFSDEVLAVGPRIGLDLAAPIQSSSITLVSSISGSLLFGGRDSSYMLGSALAEDLNETQQSSEAVKIWNVEGMAGVSFGVGDDADLTLGYRAAQFGGLMAERSDVGKVGNFDDDGQSNLLVHGPFARLTVEIP